MEVILNLSVVFYMLFWLQILKEKVTLKMHNMFSGARFAQQKLYLLTKFVPNAKQRKFHLMFKVFHRLFIQTHSKLYKGLNMQLFCSRNRMVKLVSVNEYFVFAMSLFGKEYETSDSVKETLEKLACLWYHVKLKIDLNKARCKLFASFS